MSLYIITSEVNKTSSKRALFYYKPLNKTRLYRQNLDKPDKGMVLKEYKSKQIAETVCEHVNTAYNDYFIVELKK